MSAYTPSQELLPPDLGLPDGSRVGIAVSGGADSTALLFLMHAQGAPYVLSAVHFNHGWRGAESDADEEFCRTLAERIGVSFQVRRAPPGAAEANREETAREQRLQFFHQLIETKQVDYVLTAHTRDDQAETVLFRLLRGSHLAGLAGIHRETGTGILRPLLGVRRSDLEAYLTARGETWREDSSNANEQFARNRIRHRLLPQLEEEWNPELKAALARTAQLAFDEEQFWNSYIAQAAAAIFTEKGNTLLVDASKLLSHPVAVARRLIRWAVARIKGNTRQIEYQHVEAVLDLARLAEGHGRVILPGADIMRSFDWIRFTSYEPGGGEDRLLARNQEVQLQVPGEAIAPDGSRIRIETAWAKENDTVKASDDLFWGAEEELPGTVTIRSWKPGDRYWPARYRSGGGPLKIKTLFQEERIPLWDRGTWPIITVGNRIIWARQFGPALNEVEHRESGDAGAAGRVGAKRLRITRIG